MREYAKTVVLTILFSIVLCVPIGLYVQNNIKKDVLEDNLIVEKEEELVVDNSYAGKEKSGELIGDFDHYRVTKAVKDVNSVGCFHEYIVYDYNSGSYLNEINNDKKICYYEFIDNASYVFFFYRVGNLGYTDIFSLTTGELVKTIKGAYDPDFSDKKYIFYPVPAGLEVPNSQAWSFTLANNEVYKKQDGNVVNSDDSITIKKGNSFTVIDFDGNVIFEKRKFSRVYSIARDYIAVGEDGSLKIYDNKGNVFATIIKKAQKDLVIEDFINYGDHLTLETNRGTYNYDFETGEVKKNKKVFDSINIEELEEKMAQEDVEEPEEVKDVEETNE